MSGIPTYTQSPITAAKLSGVTPQTATAPTQSTPLAPNSNAAAQPTATTTSDGYPAARPGAAPGPAPTGSAQVQGQDKHLPPTPTPTTTSYDQGPPPPQPGAFPTPFGRTTDPAGSKPTLPPPPKAGEPMPVMPSRGTTAAMRRPYPPQLSFEAPSAARRTGQSTMTSTNPSSNYPTSLPPSHYIPTNAAEADSASAPRRSLEHPPGYVQNPYAADLTPTQRLGQHSNQSSTMGYTGPSGMSAGASSGGIFNAEDGDSIWDTARKWAKVAGEKASEAEKEVWRRINNE